MVAIPEGGPPIGPPETPRKEGIARLLKDFNLEHDLHLPCNEEESPNKRKKSPGHDAVRAFVFLHYQDRPRLEGVLREFSESLPTLKSEDSRVTFLLERLTIAKTDRLESRRQRTPRRSPAGRQTPRERIFGLDLPEPDSPTLSVRHAPRPDFDMAADNFMLPPAQRARSLKRPHSGQSLSEKFRESATKAPEASSSRMSGVPMSSNMIPPLRKASSSTARQNGITSADVSFTSNGEISASESFWSSAQKGTQSPASSATTVEDDDLPTGDRAISFYTPPEGHRCFGLDGANDRDADGDIEMNDERPTQVTDYGSSPKLEDVGLDAGEGHQKSHSLGRLEHPTVLRQSILSQSEYGGIDRSQLAELDKCIARAEDGGGQLQLPSPPNTDSQPDEHDLSGCDRVHRIPLDGLSKHSIPKSFLNLPFDLRVEAMRVVQYSGTTAKEIDAAWRGTRSFESLHQLATAKSVDYVRGFTTDFSGHSLTAKLCWSSKASGRVFDLKFDPPREDKSNALERKFGRHRFLVIDVPKLERPPKDMDLGKFGSSVLDRVKDIFKHELHILGRVWRQFHVQPKSTRGSGKACAKDTLQITFFAVRSEDGEANRLDKISISQVLDWAVEFGENAGSPQCKMYSRLDLAASRTTPTIQFDPSEIVWDVDDQMPTDDPEDLEFHDPYLEPNTTKSTEAMNDGCNKISTWAMRRIQVMLGLDHLPTVVQGRIMGAKGLWHRDDDESAADEKPAKLIWISRSQIKVRQKPQSFYDADKLTFNVVRTSGQASYSAVYSDFLPILVHRRVPQVVIESVVRESVKAIAYEFLEAFPDRMDLTRWISRQNIVSGARSRSTGIDAVGGFATSKEEACLQMLTSGFEPTKCKHLADETKRVFQQYLEWIRSNFKIQLRASTMLYGIADPLGVLKPGEIHVGFSTPFEDGKQTRYNLRNLEALVARLPALGAPDIQRVRCVFHEQLSHLTDVVIFPSRGPRPLASKLQGGDYDGDQFVILWERSLVQHFRNAPVPATEDGPEKFGIEVDRVKMGEIVQEYFPGAFEERQVLDWISMNTNKRMESEQLGKITLLYEKVIYHDNSLNTLRARQLLRLHDLMIDAAKQGYRLSDKMWSRFLEKHRLKVFVNLPDPANRVFSKGSKRSDPQSRSANAARNTRNISDYVFFEVIEPSLAAAVGRTSGLAANASDDDEDLEGVFNGRLQTSKKGSVTRKELPSLQAKLADLQKQWKTITARYFDDKERPTPWRVVVEEIRAAFEAIMPDDCASDTVQEWLYRTGQDPTIWDKLRASCLVGLKIKSSSFMFSAAGYELCFIKAYATGNARPVRLDTYSQMGPKRQKRKVEDGIKEEDGDDAVEVAELQ